MIQPLTCPVCGKTPDPAADLKASPFCSERCRKVDFFRWWDGRYAIVEELAPGGAELEPDLRDAQESLDPDEY